MELKGVAGIDLAPLSRLLEGMGEKVEGLESTPVSEVTTHLTN
jgi:hypothetical protein